MKLARPNHTPVTRDELDALPPDEREKVLLVEAFRLDLIAACKRFGIEAPIASADLALVVLGEAKDALSIGGKCPGHGTSGHEHQHHEKHAELAMEATAKAMEAIQQALGAHAMETLVEIGAMTQENLDTVRATINNHFERMRLVAIAPKES